MRTASAGMVKAPTMPSAANSATMVPPNAGEAPASRSSVGNQVNIE
ncbi:hypothetical protein XOO4840 [Xanthomonas oryzae pv. oryzae KACC 10331]|uniref:Uncharacterized protein n=1 Tax=Xanthomonas oryzae pv. oryzae (strain KACC10331 / KXO85) TaxID=291331 RepID=Q05HX0_XANOR|nr:hypothetical protein XOO4840 [Xanthomonas oryzae pv. oryzae KACC 10331]